jgi:hypothetical protein
LKHLTTPGLDLRQAFGLVRDDVMKATANKQEPFTYGSLGGATVSLVQMASLSTNPPETSAAVAPTAPDPTTELRQDYEYAERVGTKQGWQSFLKTHPTGFYADLARAQLAKLNADQAGTAAAEKAKKAAEDKARLAKENAAKADQPLADADVKAAKAKRDAEIAKKREQARIVAVERKKREEARIAAQSKTASLPAQGGGMNTQSVREAKAGPRMDRAALWARCDASVSRGNRDDDIARPGRVEACVRDAGGR